MSAGSVGLGNDAGCEWIRIGACLSGMPYSRKREESALAPAAAVL